MHSPSKPIDGAHGDSGTGIAARIAQLALLYGSTVSGVPSERLNIGTRIQTQLLDLCYYTGVCTKREWAGKELDELRKELFTRFDTVYKPKDEPDYRG